MTNGRKTIGGKQPKCLADANRGLNEQAAENRKIAFELRKRRYTYQEIADELHVSIKTAHQYVNAYWEEIKDTTQEVAELVRERELGTLDALQKRLTPIALEHTDPTDLPRGEFQLKVIDRLLRIQERRAKLLGLEAPQKVDVNSGVKMDPEKVLAAVLKFSPALHRGNGTS